VKAVPIPDYRLLLPSAFCLLSFAFPHQAPHAHSQLQTSRLLTFHPLLPELGLDASVEPGVEKAGNVLGALHAEQA